MKSSILYAAASLVSFAYAEAPCSNEELDYDHLNISSSHVESQLLRIKRQTIAVDLYVHFLVSDPAAVIDTAGLELQHQYINRQYAPFGISFNLKTPTITANADWAAGIDNSKDEKMAALHQGGYNAVNIYAGEGITSGLCSMPIAGSDPLSQDTINGDGCFIPLQSAHVDNDGTMTHEVGHWFGLSHVFQGGCDDPNGDFVDDTAPQAGPSYAHMATPGDLGSCPAMDSCPTQPGSDNIQNFMDYTDCSSLFTPIQGGRMVISYGNYRANRQVAA